MSLNECRLIELPRFEDDRGTLICAEYANHIPFEIHRIFFATNIPKACQRGGHAHRTQEQVIIPMNGYFDMHLDDGHHKRSIRLNSNHLGLYVPSMIWGFLDNFAPATAYLVLASGHYDDADYYRDYSKFIDDVNKTI